MTDKQLKKIKKAAKTLILVNGTTTTLEVKEFLIKTQPNIIWKQDEISSAMDTFHSNKELKNLSYTDNGKFREYTFGSNQPTKKLKTIMKGVFKISKTKAVDLIKNTKGKFFTVTFIKQDGNERVLNGNVKLSNFMDNLGYINVRESNGDIRRINPKTIQNLKVGGNQYKVK